MKKHLKCAFCDSIAQLRYEHNFIPFRKHEFRVLTAYYKCPVCKMEFTTNEADDFTINEVYKSYRDNVHKSS